MCVISTALKAYVPRRPEFGCMQKERSLNKLSLSRHFDLKIKGFIVSVRVSFGCISTRSQCLMRHETILLSYKAKSDSWSR